ncbi:major histocompatibility complex class I-related gene protein-like [Xiphophorus maculatus]|uniref:Class I histocompatibility antigen, Gogo-B*0102 alpha chain-like n=1 Tax=Xiphophorus maculatus TaxID=8083 RepID=M3ZS42_XIPMA|nr:major histocompatibility complex class I-related gene protein-like [Xiphophorus maculatus]
MTPLIFLILVGIQGSTAVTHSLKYFYTASSGIENFPSYVSVGLVDDVQISYCDSKTNKNIPKQDWMDEVRSEHPDYWKEETETCLVKQQTFKISLETAKQRFNQTGGEHIYQQMYGCEWDNETGEVKVYDQFGYDGEDLIILDSNTQEWIAPRTQAVITANKWNNDRYDLEHEKIYLTHICVEWLKKYVNYGRSSLMRTVRPSVSFLQRFSSSPVSCFATGFYPNKTEMFWRKDGEEIHDDVEKGEILPNNDGTFQMSIYLDLSSVPPEDWTRYECVFQLSGVREDLVTRLEKNKIKTNEVNSTFMLIIIIVSVIIFGFIAAAGFILYKKKTGRKRAVISDEMKPSTSRSETLISRSEILTSSLQTLTSSLQTSSLTSISSDDSKGSSS